MARKKNPNGEVSSIQTDKPLVLDRSDVATGKGQRKVLDLSLRGIPYRDIGQPIDPTAYVTLQRVTMAVASRMLANRECTHIEDVSADTVLDIWTHRTRTWTVSEVSGAAIRDARNHIATIHKGIARLDDYTGDDPENDRSAVAVGTPESQYSTVIIQSVLGRIPSDILRIGLRHLEGRTPTTVQTRTGETTVLAGHPYLSNAGYQRLQTWRYGPENGQALADYVGMGDNVTPYPTETLAEGDPYTGNRRKRSEQSRVAPTVNAAGGIDMTPRNAPMHGRSISDRLDGSMAEERYN